MPLSVIPLSLGRLRDGRLLTPAWKAGLGWLALSWCLLAIVFLRDWLTIADLAWNISTYNHILLIPVILVWLVVQRARQLAKIEPVPWWPALIPCAGAALLWLLGAFSGLDLARQLGAVLLLIATVPVFLGVRVSAALLFPLCYMLLLVPFGDELVPPLQMITASITVKLVEWSGIPAVVEGVFIDTPAGLFEVAEACSGVKFLIGMIAFGLLVANICFLSWKRRFLFLGACLAVPILANGVRAWATIYAAQFFGAKVAAGFDHIIYGWIFFALVIAVVVAGSWRFFDRPASAEFIDADAINSSRSLGRIETRRLGAIACLAALVAIVFGAQLWARTANTMTARLAQAVVLPDVPGWHRTGYVPLVAWEPRAEGARYRVLGRYEDGKGHRVDVFLALYDRQGEGSEAGGYGQGALPPDTGWSWQEPGPAIGGGSGDRLLARGTTERVAVTWYRTGSVLTGSNARLKLANMLDRLTLTARPTTTLILSAEEREGQSAEQSIRAFHAALEPTGRWMDRVAGLE